VSATELVETAPRKRRLWSRLYRGETSFDFVGHRRRWFAISALVIIAGMAALGIRGLNFGIDFKGGTSWQLQPDHGVTVKEARSALGPVGASATIVTLGSGSRQTLEVQTDLTGTPAQQAATQASVATTLARLAHVDPAAVTVNSVGPSWGGQVTSKAVRAVIIFFIAIGLYITIRFEWKMALAAIVAVMHDLVVTVGIYALVGFPVTPDTVVAVLTILGYSLYDTIVVFDRVKENAKVIGASGKLTYSDTVNLSMNQVLMRSLNTSIVAILPILSILVIGAELLGATTLQEFGLALVIGLTSGVYSSIFIASPLLAILKEREPRYRSIRARLEARGQGTLMLTPTGMLAFVGGSSRPGVARGAATVQRSAPGANGLPRLTPRQRARVAAEATAKTPPPQPGTPAPAPTPPSPQPGTPTKQDSQPVPAAPASPPNGVPRQESQPAGVAASGSGSPPRLRPSGQRSPKPERPEAEATSTPSPKPVTPRKPSAPRKQAKRR
jgi:preprotein translocase subunit SecF